MIKEKKRSMTLRLPEELHKLIRKHIDEKYDGEISINKWIVAVLKLGLGVDK